MTNQLPLRGSRFDLADGFSQDIKGPIHLDPTHLLLLFYVTKWHQSMVKEAESRTVQVACCNLVPHSAQKRAVFSTGEAHLGQNRSGSGSLVPQSSQNFPGGPIRRQVGHATACG